ncbi:MAG: rhomboid family intramembrane serine protease [Crocinitomicaceae bacterium]|nr:rhomboid family intramembrane serine protease [Crocinitomicaceae bacterium]
MFNDQLYKNHVPALMFAFIMLGLMWTGYLIQMGPSIQFTSWGVHPREVEGLLGIFFSPFLHSPNDIWHIVNNTIGMGIVSYLLYYFYKDVAFRVLIFSWILSGGITWFIGKEGSNHIGMSGVIYAITFFLLLSGFIRKNNILIRLSLGMVFLYGSLIWGIFPIKEGISWEGHLGGFLGGLFLAILYRKNGPKERKYHYEVEEELGIEPEVEYWLPEEERTPPPEVEKPKIVFFFKRKSDESS